jgi:hypothetical protein
MPPERVVRRVLEKVVIRPNGCHVSTYSAANHGYAQVGWVEDGKRIVTLCHLVIWRAVHGLAGSGMTVDHRCRNRKCVNLEHLRLLTNLENARRTSGRDWPLGQCINGHDDVHWRPAGPDRKKGYCEPCATKVKANYARRIRAAKT